MPGCSVAAVATGGVRWESNWRWRWLPAELLSMVTHGDAGCGGSDHGGAMAEGGGLDGNDDYAAQSSKGREGDEGGAHGGSDERLGGLGGGLEATGDNGDLRRPCREEELDDEDSRRPGSCGSA